MAATLLHDPKTHEILEKANRAERRGDILLLANRQDPAQQAYRQALAAIASLPAHARETKATAELQKRLNQKLASCG